MVINIQYYIFEVTPKSCFNWLVSEDSFITIIMSRQVGKRSLPVGWQLRPRIASTVVQSNQRLCCPLTELMNSVKYDDVY